jgi:hypothetical protein
MGMVADLHDAQSVEVVALGVGGIPVRTFCAIEFGVNRMKKVKNDIPSPQPSPARGEGEHQKPGVEFDFVRSLSNAFALCWTGS